MDSFDFGWGFGIFLMGLYTIGLAVYNIILALITYFIAKSLMRPTAGIFGARPGTEPDTLMHFFCYVAAWMASMAVIGSVMNLLMISTFMSYPFARLGFGGDTHLYFLPFTLWLYNQELRYFRLVSVGRMIGNTMIYFAITLPVVFISYFLQTSSLMPFMGSTVRVAFGNLLIVAITIWLVRRNRRDWIVTQTFK